MRSVPCAAFVALACFGCTGVGDTTEGANDTAGLSVPPQVKVDGKVVDVEKDYLPRVVQCEDPDAPIEAMKAQAVAARTYLTYRAQGKTLPSITDGQSDQVYTCPANENGRFVSADALSAVQSTAGQVVLHDSDITAGFFVAGANRESMTCKRLSDPTSTEAYVTYNFGLIDSGIHPSSIGTRGDDANRGCLSQVLSNCLAESSSRYDYATLLRYFYGSDVQLAHVGATPLTSVQVVTQAMADLPTAQCWSDSFGRPVPLGSCVESATSKTWFQCQPSGTFTPSTSTSGDSGACTDVFAL